MITEASFQELFNILINVFSLPLNRDKLQTRFEELKLIKESWEYKCVKLMQSALELMNADTSCVYVVGQQTAHGCQLSNAKFYTDAELAKSEVAYWHREKCDFMKLFSLYIVRELPVYMKLK